MALIDEARAPPSSAIALARAEKYYAFYLFDVPIATYFISKTSYSSFLKFCLTSRRKKEGLLLIADI